MEIRDTAQTLSPSLETRATWEGCKLHFDWWRATSNWPIERCMCYGFLDCSIVWLSLVRKTHPVSVPTTGHGIQPLSVL
jgi:hypothetical protein